MHEHESWFEPQLGLFLPFGLRLHLVLAEEFIARLLYAEDGEVNESIPVFLSSISVLGRNSLTFSSGRRTEGKMSMSILIDGRFSPIPNPMREAVVRLWCHRFFETGLVGVGNLACPVDLGYKVESLDSVVVILSFVWPIHSKQKREREKMERGGRRVSRGLIPFLALHAVNEYYRLERKPPVTAGLLVANTLIYLRPGFLDNILPTLDEVWFNPHLILKHRDIKRFFLSAVYHMGESHLVYNMMSLLWKGIQLETSMGSIEFASMVATLLGMSQGITLLLAKALLVFDYERAYYYEHSVGFSGVLFAMKVVLNSQSENYTYVHGLVVPARHAAWVELILIQMFVPGVSFLGHLGGILAGILYLRLKGAYSGPDPLRTIIRGITGVLSWPLRFVRDFFRYRRRRISGRGAVGGTWAGRSVSGVWRCPACTYDNSGWLNVCEMCGTGRSGDGLSSNPPSNQARNLSLEELRRWRVERFGR
ncbi:hypothetical protein HHK36_020988 [Tetracentron sinense]|uniref:RanBP2-type domain-containing protein n=1 Tax=Tetracentron sinense TaxID=13715 RepID=A0A835D8H6_TETSI|nr:hypothetical protein HHK36_020988 [Tetracentron sinense]